jgi:hypothetical protein
VDLGPHRRDEEGEDDERDVRGREKGGSTTSDLVEGRWEGKRQRGGRGRKVEREVGSRERWEGMSEEVKGFREGGSGWVGEGGGRGEDRYGMSCEKECR